MYKNEVKVVFYFDKEYKLNAKKQIATIRDQYSLINHNLFQKIFLGEIIIYKINLDYCNESVDPKFIQSIKLLINSTKYFIDPYFYKPC